MTGTLDHPKVTTYTKVAVYRRGRGSHKQTFGYTTQGRQALNRIMDAMQQGHTVSVREYWDETKTTRYMDAEIVWDGFDA